MEDIEKEESGQYAMQPIPPQYQNIFDHYKKQEANFWTDEEISRDLMQDAKDRDRVSSGERRAFDRTQAFFAISDGVVNEGMVDKILRRVKPLVIKTLYIYQGMMENVHNIVYSNIIVSAVTDAKERDKLLNSAAEDPIIKRKIDWIHSIVEPENDIHDLQNSSIRSIRKLVEQNNGMLKLLHPNEDIEKYKDNEIKKLESKLIKPVPSLARLIAGNAIMEGVYFSGSFCIIEAFGQRGLFPGATKANKKIREDEGLHVRTAGLVYKNLKYKLSQTEIYEMIDKAIDIEIDSVVEALQEGLLGITVKNMTQYVKFQADYTLKILGYEKKYKVANPFPFMMMLSIDMDSDDFFKTDVVDYSRNTGTAEDKIISFNEDSSSESDSD